MKIIAAIVIVLGLAFCRVLAIVVNQFLWLWFLADKPRGMRPPDYSDQIWLPEMARKGFWPLLLVFPLFLAGMGVMRMIAARTLIDQISLPYLGVVIATIGGGTVVVGGVLFTGAVWGLIRDTAAYPNRRLASRRLTALTKHLEQGDVVEPITTYRHYWRACYGWEMITSSKNSSAGSSVASLQRVEALLDQFEADLQRAAREVSAGAKLQRSAQKLMSSSGPAIQEWRRTIQEVANQKRKLLEDWPDAAVSHRPASLRIVQLKPSMPVQQLQVDDTDVTALLKEHKGGTAVVVTALSEAVGPTTQEKRRSARGIWGEFDFLCPVALGTHKLTIGQSRNSHEHVIEIRGGRNVALISFDTYADSFTVSVFSSEASVETMVEKERQGAALAKEA